MQKELGDKKITLEGVKNYYKIMDTKQEMHKYIIGTIFKELYEKKENKDTKPQMFIFFDSIDEIKEFHEYFTARATDFTSD